jgi:plastocyanin
MTMNGTDLIGRSFRPLFRAGLLAAALIFVGSPAFAVQIDVKIDNFVFSPDVVTITPGTVVVFHNYDDIPHSVVATSKEFRSKALDTDETYSFTFTKVGTFDYFCGLHPHMKGKIIVTP